jgi:hypothetical protein
MMQYLPLYDEAAIRTLRHFEAAVLGMFDNLDMQVITCIL